MDERQERQIIATIARRVGKEGRCSVGAAASEILYHDLPAAAKRSLALKIAHGGPYLAQQAGNDWIITRDPARPGPFRADTESRFSNIHLLVGTLVSLLATFVIWKFAGTASPPPGPQYQQQLLADTSMHWQGPKALKDSLKKKQEQMPAIGLGR